MPEVVRSVVEQELDAWTLRRLLAHHAQSFIGLLEILVLVGRKTLRRRWSEHRDTAGPGFELQAQVIGHEHDTFPSALDDVREDPVIGNLAAQVVLSEVERRRPRIERESDVSPECDSQRIANPSLEVIQCGGCALPQTDLVPVLLVL